VRKTTKQQQQNKQKKKTPTDLSSHVRLKCTQIVLMPLLPTQFVSYSEYFNQNNKMLSFCGGTLLLEKQQFKQLPEDGRSLLKIIKKN
jgi:hypothetical protein